MSVIGLSGHRTDIANQSKMDPEPTSAACNCRTAKGLLDHFVGNATKNITL
ncbi:MAG: hypothetical protein WA661_09355 [Xanthobacteraceae bacterium]